MGARIYSGDVEQLEGREPFSDGECVALVQAVTSVGLTAGRHPRNMVKSRDIHARGDKTYKQGNPYADCDNADQFYVVMV